MEALIIVPSVLFLVIVAPIWLILHYKYKSKMTSGITEQEIGELESMLETIDRLSDRIATLEKILESDQPGWKKP